MANSAKFYNARSLICMSDINFLPGSANNDKKKSGGEKKTKQKTNWTKPDQNKDAVFHASEKNARKPAFFSRLCDFFKKSQKSPALDSEKSKYSEEDGLKPAEKQERGKTEKVAIAAKAKQSIFKRKINSAKEDKKLKSDQKEDDREKTKPVKKNPVAESASVKKWNAHDILETNLIKDELTAFFDWKRGTAILLANIAFFSLVVAGAHQGLLFWGEQKKRQEKERPNLINKLNERIRPLEKEMKKIIKTRQDIKLAKDLLASHIYWTNFFKFLEENTLRDVYYSGGFSGNDGGEYLLSAKAKDFKTILSQVEVLRSSDYVVRADVSGGSISSSKQENKAIETEASAAKNDMVNFQLQLLVDPEIFKK